MIVQNVQQASTVLVENLNLMHCVLRDIIAWPKLQEQKNIHALRSFISRTSALLTIATAGNARWDPSAKKGRPGQYFVRSERTQTLLLDPRVTVFRVLLDLIAVLAP